MLSPTFLAASINSALGIVTRFNEQTYSGNGTSQNIITDIDSTGGGNSLAMIKALGLSTNTSWQQYDTVRGATNALLSDTTLAETVIAQGLTSFNSDGFSVGSHTGVNQSGFNYLSLQFLKEEGFFDIVSYVGNSTARLINHNLNGEVGHLIVKSRDDAFSWYDWHRGFGATEYLSLNLTNTKATSSNLWNGTPTTTQFGVGTNSATNNTSSDFIAYLFAHNPSKGIFCGSYTGTGAAGNKQTIGFRPKTLIIKASSVTADWYLVTESISGASGFLDSYVLLNTNGVATSLGGAGNRVILHSDGFSFEGAPLNSSGVTDIFIALAEEIDPAWFDVLFRTQIYSANGDTSREIYTGIDAVANDVLVVSKNLDLALGWSQFDTVRGATNRLTWDVANAEVVDANSLTAFNEDGYTVGNSLYTNRQAADGEFWSWVLKKEAGFFDIVTYTGDGVVPRTINHSLNHEVGFILTKCRSKTATRWAARHKDLALTDVLYLDTTDAAFAFPFYNSKNPTTTQFELGTAADTVNESGQTYISYLFAHNPSKGIFCGSYSGTGAAGNKQTIGFRPKTIIFKRTNGLSDWFLLSYDLPSSSSTGLGSFIEPSTADPVFDYGSTQINLYDDGFDFVGSEFNASGWDYAFIAIG